MKAVRAMVIGNVPQEMAIFAENLGELTDTPVTYTDRLLQQFGSEDRAGEAIREQVAHPEWIIVGNAFKADSSHRIARAQAMYCFDWPPGKLLREYAYSLVDEPQTLLFVRSALGTQFVRRYRERAEELHRSFPLDRDLAYANAREHDTHTVTFRDDKSVNRHLAYIRNHLV